MPQVAAPEEQYAQGCADRLAGQQLEMSQLLASAHAHRSLLVARKAGRPLARPAQDHEAATTILLQRSWEDLEFSLRWLYVGFAIALAWGTLQSVYVIAYHPTYFSWMNRLQSLISIRKLFTTRISGMTYEPKWFAEQITFVLIPWLLGAVLSGRSSHFDAESEDEA